MMENINMNKNIKEYSFLTKNDNYIAFGVALLFSVPPYLFVDEKMILSSPYMIEYMNTITSYYPAIEYYSSFALKYDLYNSVKFQLSWTFISMILTFVISFIFISLIYLNSLEYINIKNKLFFDKNINKNKTYLYFKDFIKLILIVSLIFIAIYDLNDYSLDTELRVIQSTQIGSLFFCVIYSSSMVIFSIAIIETIAQIRKKFL